MLHAVTIFWFSRTVWLSNIWKEYGTKIGTVRHSSVPIPTSVANKGKTWEKKKEKKNKKRKKEKGREKESRWSENTSYGMVWYEVWSG